MSKHLAMGEDSEQTSSDGEDSERSIYNLWNASLEFEFDRGSPRIRTRPQFLNMADWEELFSKKQFFDRIVGVLQQTADPKQGIRLDDDLNEIPLKSSERVCRQHNQC